MTDVVVLAGGKGTRLRPYTTVLPKPLMPVGDMPVLEILLRRLRADGFGRIHLAVGHLAELIEAYFGDGSRFGVQLVYSREDEPLGTAAPLARIELEFEHVLVLNGDLVTTLDFGAIVRRHAESGARATVAVHRRDVAIDYGIVHVDDDQIVDFEEKPTLTYDVSMGIYVFDRDVIDLIPPNRKFDFPDLLRLLLDRGDRAGTYRSDDFWLDIGRIEDYELAVEKFDEIRDTLLPT